MFRSSVIIASVYCFTLGCKNSPKQDLPDNAIDPVVIENPVTASSENRKDNFPVLQFEKDLHDFGNIIDGEKVSYAFKFKNVGKGDLIIRSAQGSCGCTVPEYPKDPVKPGEGGLITVTFNSEGRVGNQQKEVTIISNTMPNTYKISIKANVEKAN